MAGTQSMKVELSTDARRAMNNLTKAIEDQNKLKRQELRDSRAVHGGSTEVDPEVGVISSEEDLVYTEDTVYTVHAALARVLRENEGNRTSAEFLANEMVSSMQNAGIKFREVRR